MNTNDSLSLKSTLLTIGSYLRFLAGKWWLYFIALAVAVGISFLYLSIRPNAYVAHSTFMTQSDDSGGMSSLMQIAGEFGVVAPSSSGDDLSAEKLIELMGTRYILSTALLAKGTVEGKEDLLANHFLTMLGGRSWYDEGDKFTSTKVEDFSRKENEMINELVDIIQSKVLEASNSENGIIRASIRTYNEEVSKQLMEVLLDVVTEYHLNTSVEKQEEDLGLLNDRLDSIKNKLSIAEYNLSKWYQEQSRSLRASAVSANKYVEQVRLDREAEILGQAYIEITKGKELAQITLLRKKPVIQIIDRPTYPLENDEPNKALIFGLSIIGLLGLTTLLLILWKMIRDALAS